MPYPRWLARVNKRLFNPRSIRKGDYPVLAHVGRTSGKTYHTPLDAYPTKSGYVLVCRYGPESDWVQNTLATDHATLLVNGQEHSLGSPRLASLHAALGELVSDEVPANFTKAADFLLMEEKT